LLLLQRPQDGRYGTSRGSCASNRSRAALCRMFNHAIGGQRAMPKHLGSDYGPLFTFERWRACLRILDVIKIKTEPYVPISHPFVERLIGIVRVSGSHVVLDGRRSRKQAARVPELLQQASHAYFTGGTTNPIRARACQSRLRISTPIDDNPIARASIIYLLLLDIVLSATNSAKATTLRNDSVLRIVTKPSD
jgi:hypothetical protein